MAKKNQKRVSIIDEFETIKEKFNDSTSTVDELRHAVFAPINNFTHNSKTAIELKEKKKITRKTNWGEITIENKLLSQKHKDLFDCIITYAQQVNLEDGTNTIAYTFTGNEMLKKYYGENSKTRNLAGLDKLLTDMMGSVISIKANNGDKAKFQLFSFAGYKDDIGSYLVKINSDYVKFFANSLTINYSENLPDIIKIKEPIIKAIIRLALTQKETLTMKIFDPSQPVGKTGILEAIGFPIEVESQKKKAFKALKDNVDLLKQFGVYYNPSEQKNIRYKKKLDIRFIPPTAHTALLAKGENEEEYFVKLQDFVHKEFEKDSNLYTIIEIKIDVEHDKLMLSCFLSSDENKEIKNLPMPNMPSKAYKWLESCIKDI